MPQVGPLAFLAPGQTVTWEITYAPGVTFFPPQVVMVKPEPLALGFVGVLFGVSNLRTSIVDRGGTPAYTVQCEVSNLATPTLHTIPVPYQITWGSAT